MVSIKDRREGLAKINAESTDVLQVNYTDINKRVDYIFSDENSVVWDTNNPADDTPIQQPAEIEFATDEEVEQAIQAIIDSYNEGKN